MALTAAIRTALMGLVAAIVGALAAWLTTSLGVEISPEDQLKIVGSVVGFVVTFGSGLVSYAVNKWGSKWPVLNQIFSLGRAKTGAMYVPSDKESVTATATPAGQPTEVTTVGPQGGVSSAPV